MKHSCYYIICFECLWALLSTFILFWDNLLTEGPSHIAVSCLFQCFEENQYQTESKRNETFGSVIFGMNVIQRTWSASQEAAEAATRVEGAPTFIGRAPISWAPQVAIDLLLPPIYTHVPWEHPRSQQKTISTAVTFCIREIPSWSLRRRSAGGEIDHGGLLHQHHSPSDELWVVYHRPLGP